MSDKKLAEKHFSHFQSAKIFYLKSLKEKKSIDFRILGSDYINKSFTGDDLEIPIHFHNRDHTWSVSNARRRIIETTIS